MKKLYSVTTKTLVPFMKNADPSAITSIIVMIDRHGTIIGHATSGLVRHSEDIVNGMVKELISRPVGDYRARYDYTAGIGWVVLVVTEKYQSNRILRNSYINTRELIHSLANMLSKMRGSNPNTVYYLPHLDNVNIDKNIIKVVDNLLALNDLFPELRIQIYYDQESVTGHYEYPVEIVTYNPHKPIAPVNHSIALKYPYAPRGV